MSLPPERISIKRRRQDDPIEALLLEQAPGRDKKRRATDFVFRRLRADEIENENEDLAHLPKPPRHVTSGRQEKQRSASQNDNSGIPHIKTTLPGDEIKLIKAFKDTHISQMGDTGIAVPEKEAGGHQTDPNHDANSARKPIIKVPTNARRFHLSRDHNLLGPPRQHAGVRKPAHHPKTHLATFVEKGLVRVDPHTQFPSQAPPIHRNVDDEKVIALDSSMPNAPDSTGHQMITKHVSDQLFVKPSINGAKQGHSINTHPDTWDFDSDQLASELAAFAFELDPTSNSEHVASHPINHMDTVTMEITEGEYIYETYIRLPHNADLQAVITENHLTANIGVLVIAEEDEDLWEAFAESDDENEWDEEDADSNAEDNPANDYPEDEVSSDDEFGLGAYNHRRNASDDEEYDLERDE